MTSSMGLLANDDQTSRFRRSGRGVTTTSPSGLTAHPGRRDDHGIEMSCPITVVDRSRFSVAPMTCGTNPSSPKASTLSE